MNHVFTKELLPCLLCYDAPCSQHCKEGMDPAKIIRSIRLENRIGGMEKIRDCCFSCDAPCEKHCVLQRKLPIKHIMENFYDYKTMRKFTYDKVDLSTEICGIKIENPFLLSSSVVSSSYDMCKRALQAGWAGVCFKTICMMDIHEASPRFSAVKSIDGAFVAFRNIEQLSDHSLTENFAIFHRLKEEFPTKFLLVSIMGRDEEEWRYLAKEAEKSGADALELNFSCPNMTEEFTGSDVGQIPELVERYTRVVKDSVSIPVISKLTPNVMTMSPAAEAAKRGGADGIAAINTIKSITDLNVIHSLDGEVADSNILVGGLSGPSVKPIALRFISELSQNENLKGIHISAMGGIYTWIDAASFIALGAGSLQVTTAVMEYGYRIIDDLVEGLQLYLAFHKLSSVKELQGALLNRVTPVTEIARDYIIYPKFIREKCVGCGRCYISCQDGGHQAIKFENRVPTLDPKKCVGCHLCIMVCPNESVVSSEIKVKKQPKQ